MDARLFRRVQRYGWDAAAGAYDRGWVPVLERLTRGCVDRAALGRGERVLDMATGPGVGAFIAARAVGPTGAVTGIDISEKMVALAKLRAAEGGLSNVSFERRDMEETGAPDAGYDAVLCAFGLMFAAERNAALAEIRRVLVSGGRVSTVVWGRRSHCAWSDVFPIVDRHVQSEVCPNFFSLGVPGVPEHAFALAGLRDVFVERVAVTLSWASEDEACCSMLEGGPVALAWSRFSAEARAEVRSAYLASIDPFRRGQRYDVAAEVVFVSARKA